MDDVDINWEITERETQAFRTMWNRQENIETSGIGDWVVDCGTG